MFMDFVTASGTSTARSPSYGVENVPERAAETGKQPDRLFPFMPDHGEIKFP